MALNLNMSIQMNHFGSTVKLQWVRYEASMRLCILQMSGSKSVFPLILSAKSKIDFQTGRANLLPKVCNFHKFQGIVGSSLVPCWGVLVIILLHYHYRNCDNHNELWIVSVYTRSYMILSFNFPFRYQLRVRYFPKDLKELYTRDKVTFFYLFDQVCIKI